LQKRDIHLSFPPLQKGDQGGFSNYCFTEGFFNARYTVKDLPQCRILQGRKSSFVTQLSQFFLSFPFQNSPFDITVKSENFKDGNPAEVSGEIAETASFTFVNLFLFYQLLVH